MLRITNENEFNDVIKDGKVLVDFGAEWCAPCKMFHQVLEEIDKENIIKILQIDVDRYRGLAKIYRILSVPTIMIFQDGELINQQTGFMTKSELKDFISK